METRDRTTRPVRRPRWRGVTLLVLAAIIGWACGGSRSTPERAATGAGGTERAAPAAARPSVVPGARVLLEDSFHLVRGKRVGLVTNQTGLGTIELLRSQPEVRLVALFSPEHGLRGEARPGESVESGRDSATGLPVYSLYGEHRRPEPEALRGLDVLLFDIQDVGARYYTYASTMELAMEAAGEAGIPFVVLDRPDPIGGVLVQGNVLDTAFASFVGMDPVPMRPGMTLGELARMMVGEFGVRVELHVVPARGWRRWMWFDDTGMPWVPPSPNIPDLESAIHYPGTCLFEGTNLSVGRGTEHPFQWIGAPWLDGNALARRLEAYGIPGVRFEAASFTPHDPSDGKFPGVEVHGVRFVLTDRETYDPTRAAVAALVEARRMSGDRWRWRPGHFDRLAGTDRLRKGIESGEGLERLVRGWGQRLEAFRKLRARYLIYGGLRRPVQ